MTTLNQRSRWRGLRKEAQKQLTQRDYEALPLEERLAYIGLNAGQILDEEHAFREAGVWIPGVELFHRTIHRQRHRGVFGEFARQGKGLLGRIGFWPQQWATARMTAGTAKGFHIHPPYIPEKETPEHWFKRLYLDEPQNSALRPYDQEQWDVMFFVNGRAEMFLVDERDGLPRRIMRIFIDGDNHPGPDTVGVVIPAGVAHAIRTEGSEDLIMVYGTSTVFEPLNEGRIRNEVEFSTLPPSWDRYLIDS